MVKNHLKILRSSPKLSIALLGRSPTHNKFQNDCLKIVARNHVTNRQTTDKQTNKYYRPTYLAKKFFSPSRNEKFMQFQALFPQLACPIFNGSPISSTLRSPKAPSGRSFITFFNVSGVDNFFRA